MVGCQKIIFSPINHLNLPIHTATATIGVITQPAMKTREATLDIAAITPGDIVLVELFPVQMYLHNS